MKKSILIIALLIVQIAISQQGDYAKMIDTTLAKTVRFISADSLKNNYAKFQILDTREKKEYKISHLKESSNVGYNKFNLEKTIKQLSKKKPIVLYCSIGYRSEKIAEKLQAKGFEVYNLYGGIFQWKNNGYSVVNTSNTITEQVHCFDETWSKWLINGEKIYE